VVTKPSSSGLAVSAAAFVVLLVIATASAPRATAGERHCDTLESQERECADQLAAPSGYSAVQATRLGLAGRAKTLLGSSYAGTRTTRSGGALVQIAKGDEVDPRVLDAMPGRVDVRRVPLSQRTLDAAQHSVVAELEGVDVQGGARVYSREGTGSVVVAVKRLGREARAALRAAAKPAKLLLRLPSPIHLRQYPPHQGGLHLNVGRFSCTSGFDVVDRSDISLGLTAGHCGQFGDPVSIGGVPVGTIEGSVFDDSLRSYSDSALYSVPAEHQTAQVFTGAASQPVRAAFANSAFHRGMLLCFFGYRSARRRCGRITARNVTTIAGRLVITNSTCMRGRSRSGDSGGPVYQQAGDGGVVAAGMVSTGGKVKVRRHRFRQEMCFTKIANALTGWDIFILVQ
jgi:hypothetical protein